MIPTSQIDYGPFKCKQYEYIDNWDEVYKNYFRNACTFTW